MANDCLWLDSSVCHDVTLLAEDRPLDNSSLIYLRSGPEDGVLDNRILVDMTVWADDGIGQDARPTFYYSVVGNEARTDDFSIFRNFCAGI